MTTIEPTSRPIRISAVVPLRDEAESLGQLHAELVRAFDGLGLAPDEAEILLVDDGSRDDSWRVIADLAGRDARVRGIRFRRNFGKAAALTAGFRASRGAIVFTLDGDLQDDPSEIPRFLAKLDEGDGLDVVSGWKRRRHDPWHKVGPSRVFNALVSRLTGCRLHDHNCGFKAYRRAVVEEVHLYGELHRFVPVLAFSRGFRVGEIVVHHRARLVRGAEDVHHVERPGRVARRLLQVGGDALPEQGLPGQARVDRHHGVAAREQEAHHPVGRPRRIGRRADQRDALGAGQEVAQGGVVHAQPPFT